MNDAAILEMASFSGKHWWFNGRYALLRQLVKRYAPTGVIRVLDAGCGSGDLLKLLSADARLRCSGLDLSEAAARLCRAKGLTDIVVGDIIHTPFVDNSFDVVVAADILEHIDHDRRVLQEIWRILKPNGMLVFSVPADPHLWSSHDNVVGHQRRYDRHELEHKFSSGGYRVKRLTYCMCLLWLPVVLARRFKKKAGSDLKMPPAALNAALGAIVAWENALIAAGIDLPFGVSLAGVAVKK